MNNLTRFRDLYAPYTHFDNASLWYRVFDAVMADYNDGNLDALLNILNDLPNITKKVQTDFTSDAVTIGGDAEYNDIQKINAVLRQLIPWRKGPFQIFDIHVDSEWRSNLKWNRLKDKISPLNDRKVLDVGSNNGYYGWRMRGAGAAQVIGIDPSVLAVIQHFAINHIIRDYSHVIFPLKMEDIPPRLEYFDTVFSMGVLYHRRGPLDHIQELYDALRTGGELVIETLVVEGGDGYSFVPPGRYARMNNVWFLPSVSTLKIWLDKIGFDDIIDIDLHATTIDEQRTTEWKPGASLVDFLDPEDPTKTIEGHPAPLRVTLRATKPNRQNRLKRYQL